MNLGNQISLLSFHALSMNWAILLYTIYPNVLDNNITEFMKLDTV